jgi:hypothetical protein
LGLDLAGAGAGRHRIFRHPLHALDIVRTATDLLNWVLFGMLNQDFLI